MGKRAKDKRERRGKRVVPGVCAACRNERLLCASDILSCFGLRPLKRSDGLFYDLRGGPAPQARLGNAGPWEHLLCQECERKRSRVETYVARLLGEPSRLTVPVAGGCAWNHCDYKSLKLFQMWMLWMAHLSAREFFSNVNLGPAHAERLRRMLLADDPGRAWEYSCAMWVMRLDGIHRNDFACSPFLIKRGSAHNVYLFFFGGYIWEYAVANDVRRHFSSRLALQEDGTFVTLAFEVRGSDFERFLLEHIAFPNAATVDQLRLRLGARIRNQAGLVPSVS